MWIVPKNYTQFSASALDTVASSEDLGLPDLHIESSLMWRSKPSQLPTWLRRWKRDSWFRHLSGRILKPCQHTALESALTYSLAVIPASPLARQGFAEAQTTPDISGPIYGDTLNQLDLFDASLKTSRAISASDSEKSSKTWKALVTQRRGEYSARLKSARRTKENGSISWPTPSARDYKGGYQGGRIRNGKISRDTLDVAVQHSDNQRQSAGQLNPTWVEWLMGLPLGWTDLGSWGTE